MKVYVSYTISNKCDVIIGAALESICNRDRNLHGHIAYRELSASTRSHLLIQIHVYIIFIFKIHR